MRNEAWTTCPRCGSERTVEIARCARCGECAVLASQDAPSRGRRAFLGTLLLGAAAFTTRGLFAEELARTPPQTEGPFYPDKLPLDTDNDLLIVNDAITPAVGEITHLSGRILDAKGNPVRNALVEIWQWTTTAPTSTPGPQPRPARQELPGLRPLPDRLDRRVLLPHHQAGPLPRPDAAHPLQDQEGRARSCSRRSATSRATPATSRTASTAASATRRPASRSPSISPRSRTRASASWRRGSTSSSASRRKPE